MAKNQVMVDPDFILLRLLQIIINQMSDLI